MQFSRPFTGVTSYGRVGGGGPGHGGADLRHRRGATAGQGRDLLRLGGQRPAEPGRRGPGLELHRHPGPGQRGVERAAGPDPDRRRHRPPQQAVFYTALYHSLLYPSVFSDDNRQYLGVDGRVHTVDPGHAAFYTNFSGWDIYRAQAQLEALVDPDAASDAAQSMVDDYAQGGMLPKWMQNNGETYVMVGDPADADPGRLLRLRRPPLRRRHRAGRHDRRGDHGPARSGPASATWTQLGFLPVDGSYGCCNYYEPVSTTLEYDTDDFAISALAGALGQRRRAGEVPRTGPRTGATCSTRSAAWTSAASADGSWEPGFEPRSHVRLRRGRLAGLHRHGAVQPGRPGQRQGRPRRPCRTT